MNSAKAADVVLSGTAPRRVVEAYSQDLMRLHGYMRGRDFDIVNEIGPFLDWYKGTKQTFLKGLGIRPSTLRKANDDGDIDSLYEPGGKIQAYIESDPLLADSYRKHLANWHMKTAPVNAPTWAHADLVGSGRIHRETWLVHFSDSADKIRRYGFRFGAADYTCLGLTTCLSAAEKSQGGYNFAYVADSRDASKAARNGTYGRDAVLFRAAGVRIDHYGDEEEQVIFDGRTVRPSDIVYLSRESESKRGDEWAVQSSDDRTLFTGNLSNVVEWVRTHWHQYRRILFGR